MIEQRGHKSRNLQHKALLTVVVFAFLVTISWDCYLLVNEVIGREVMTTIFIVTVFALMSGLTLSDRLVK